MHASSSHANPPAQRAEADELETYDGRWVRPADALAQVEKNEIQMIFPTLKHLERIATFATVETPARLYGKRSRRCR